MNRRGNHMNSLREEISYVDAYAYIISERLGDKFVYKKEIDEDLLNIEVPKLIVQPIVENAVEHGIRQVQKGSKIERLLTQTIDPEKERSLSLGIRNVNSRLKLIYGEKSGLSIESVDEEYTLSTITILDKNYMNNK